MSADAADTSSLVELRPEELVQAADLRKLSCHQDLDHWVENYWQLSWDLPPGQELRQPDVAAPDLHTERRARPVPAGGRTIRWC